MRIRRIMLLAALAAMLVILAIPVAFAQDRDERREERLEERFEENGFFFDEDRFFEEDGFFFFDGDRFEDDDFDNGSGSGQNFDQEAECGDVDQSFDVSSAGDNSNQCVGIQGVTNTGNAQNQTGVLQYGSEADGFEFEDSGADIDVSPEASTTCDKQVNQAASPFGGK
jgi:hypothetical protein